MREGGEVGEVHSTEQSQSLVREGVLVRQYRNAPLEGD